jgi:hypothetical protein
MIIASSRQLNDERSVLSQYENYKAFAAVSAAARENIS